MKHNMTVSLHGDRRYVLLRFSDGLVVDPRRCPLGIKARSHWRPGALNPNTGVNAVCACDPEA